MINKKSGLVIVGAVILMMILVAGCLGSDTQNPKAGAGSIQCSESVGSGQNMIINETQSNATICANLKQLSNNKVDRLHQTRIELGHNRDSRSQNN